MALPNIFATQPAGNVPAADLDANFNAVGAMAITACTASGTNVITLTPNASQPAVNSYSNYQQFSFVPAGNSSGPVTITIGSLASIPLYLGDGVTQATGGTLTISMLVAIGYNSALNSGGGGFTIVGAQGATTGQNLPNYLSPGGYVNKFRNPTFDVWQRGTSGSVTTGNTAYSADGWIVGATGATLAWAQSANNNNLIDYYRLMLTGNTSMTDSFIRQRIESYIVQPLVGQQVTVQFVVYNSTGASITPTLTVKHAASQDSWGSPVTDVSAVNLQPVASATLVTLAYSFAVNSAAYYGLEITIDFGAALNSNSKIIDIYAADIRTTPSATTGLISNPPVIEARPVGPELGLCQRYLNSTYGNNVAPGTATKLGMVLCGSTPSSTTTIASVSFPVQMRAAPSVTVYDSAGTSAKNSSVPAGSTTFTDGQTPSTSPTNISTTGFMMTGNTAAGGSVAFCHYVATSEL